MNPWHQPPRQPACQMVVGCLLAFRNCQVTTYWISDSQPCCLFTWHSPEQGLNQAQRGIPGNSSLRPPASFHPDLAKSTVQLQSLLHILSLSSVPWTATSLALLQIWPASLITVHYSCCIQCTRRVIRRSFAVWCLVPMQGVFSLFPGSGTGSSIYTFNGRYQVKQHLLYFCQMFLLEACPLSMNVLLQVHRHVYIHQPKLCGK